jgi:hypothetical protein
MRLGSPNSLPLDGRTSVATPENVAEVAIRFGFRRVEHVHIVVGEPTTAMVTGICHRYPHSVRVPLAVAARFVAAGAPVTVEGTYEPREAVGI